MSNFTKVAELNTAWGNLAGDPKNPDWDKLANQAKNILDEYNELFDDGINPKDINEVRDAICDILVFTYGLAHLAGVNADKDMRAVDKSNRSKFVADEVAEEQTKLKYAAMGVHVEFRGMYPLRVVYSPYQQTDEMGNIYRAGKILKAVSFKEPKFKKL